MKWRNYIGGLEWGVHGFLGGGHPKMRTYFAALPRISYGGTRGAGVVLYGGARVPVTPRTPLTKC